MLGFNITSVAAAALVISGVLAQKKTVPTCCGAREGFPAQILRCEYPQKFNCLNNGFKATCHAAYFDESLDERQIALIDVNDCTRS